MRQRARAGCFALVVFSCLCAVPSAAEDITGSHLIEFCDSASASDLALCHGFFRGLSDTHSIYAAMGKGLHLYCLPRGVTQEQFERVAFKWIEANPELQDRPAAVLIVQALNQGFPCTEDGQAATDGDPPDGAPPEPAQAGGDVADSADDR